MTEEEKQYLCPVEGCDHPPFTTVQARQSHIRNVHPEHIEPSGIAREVPIVEEDFATLLRKFKIKSDLANNIAENISHTGGPRAFEDVDILIKRLSFWSSDIPPAKRQLIVDQWFAERGIPIPEDIRERAGMTTEQIREAEKRTKEEDGVRYIYDTESHQIRMAQEGERGGTLSQAKELKKMAEDDEGIRGESPFIQDGQGNWILNPKARISGVELMAYEGLKRAQEKGEPFDPMEAMSQAAERMKIMRESLGISSGTNVSSTPTWMNDPVTFLETINNLKGGKGEDSALKETLAIMQKTIEEMKEERWESQFNAQQKQIGDIVSTLNKSIDMISDLKKGQVGRTEMDIIHDIAEKGFDLAKTELPGLRRDLREAVSSINLPATKTTKQREERKTEYKEALDTDQEIEELGKRIFFPVS